MRKYDLDDNSANGVSSVVYVISAIASPILGNLVDRTGRNVMWVFLAVVVTLGCHAVLTFTFWNPYIPMVRFWLVLLLIFCYYHRYIQVKPNLSKSDYFHQIFR